MNIRKVFNKATWVLAGLLVLVLIALTVYQHWLTQSVSRNASMEAATTGEATGGGDMGSDADKNQMDESGRQPGAAEERDVAQKDELKNQRIELQRKILEDPSIKKSVQSGIDAQYATLFDALDLSPEQREKLKNILTESAMDYLAMNPDILSAATDEEKALIQRGYDNLRQETQLRVEALLGSDEYEKYQSFEDRTFPRKVVSGFVESLTPADRLTENQEKELIEILYGEAGKVFSEIGYDPTKMIEFPSDLDTATVIKKMEITDRILSNSAESAKKLLSASQLEAFNNYLKSYSEKEEKSLIMRHQQYGE